MADHNDTSIPKPDFGPSELGTKNYWDKVYDRENVNYEDHGDIGEIWFGEDAAMKMVDWVEEHYEDEKKTCSVLDLGCGNGHLLLDLAELGFEDLTGIDYSPSAIRLAKAIAKDKQLDGVIRYAAVDFLAEKETLEWSRQGADGEPKKFRVLLDKGTYDAISLHQKKNASKDQDQQEPAEQEGKDIENKEEDIPLAENDDSTEDLADRYPRRVAAMMQDDGRLLITSCNWTQEELIRRFSHVFEYDSHIRYPTFKFGGVVGQTISSVVFKKKASA
ncbi:hypothetical protein BGW41_002537 [Actinomortierella wolfii]|nr:hypothetical protein BGW41_002537 [Actinomortierella wolfii]